MRGSTICSGCGRSPSRSERGDVGCTWSPVDAKDGASYYDREAWQRYVAAQDGGIIRSPLTKKTLTVSFSDAPVKYKEWVKQAVFRAAKHLPENDELMADVDTYIHRSIDYDKFKVPRPPPPHPQRLLTRSDDCLV